jgi:fructosamine-3-kinase
MLELQPDLPFSKREAERLLEAWLGGPVVCSRTRRLKGGLVNTVVLLTFDRPPHRAVLKLHDGAGDVFGAEARALEHLRSETACPVPQVYLDSAAGGAIPYAYLLLEYVPGRCLERMQLSTAAQVDLEAQLAEVLAELHDHQGDRFGRLGEADGSDDWPELFAARLRDVRAQPTVSERLEPKVLAAVDDAIGRTSTVLADAGAPTLVHGDVWAGNIVIRRDGSRWKLAALLDPDLQFADVEYELAYQEVFDAQRPELFEAYRRRNELRPGYERRRRIYWLYTALVHVALFGDPFFRTYTATTAQTIARSDGG